MAKNLITESIVLPSAAVKLYGPNFDGHLTIRAMTTVEERIMYSGQSFYKTMSKIVNNCIVDNDNQDGTPKIDCTMLTDFDFFALLVKLRILSYGPKYKTVATCRTCGRQFVTTVNLADLEYSLVPDDFVEPYSIGPLPRSGDTIGCRFLRVSDRLAIEKEKDIILTKNPDFDGDPAYELEMQRRIMKVNDEDMDIIAAKDYVENMTVMDSQMYHDQIGKPFGVIKIGFTDCTGCGGTAHWILSPDREFFRSVLED